MEADKVIRLGQKVRNKITGFVGIATARTEWINGCIRFTVEAEYKKGEKESPTDVCDEKLLEVVSAGISKDVEKYLEPVARQGGPQRMNHRKF